MNNKTLIEYLVKKYACKEAKEWVGERDLETAWKECKNANWMIWFGIRLRPDLACDWAWCAAQGARLALKYYTRESDLLIAAIEAAESWSNNPTEENAEHAREAARDFQFPHNSVSNRAHAAYYAAKYASDTDNVWIGKSIECASFVIGHRDLCEIIRSRIPDISKGK